MHRHCRVSVLIQTSPPPKPYPPDNRPPNNTPQKQRKFTRVPQPSTITYLLLLGLIVGGIPLLGLVRGVDDLAGRRAERLRRSPGGRHCEEINLSRWEAKKEEKSPAGRGKVEVSCCWPRLGEFRLVSMWSGARGDFFRSGEGGILSRGGEGPGRFVRSPCSENPLVLNPIGQWWGPLLRAFGAWCEPGFCRYLLMGVSATAGALSPDGKGVAQAGDGGGFRRPSGNIVMIL